MNYNEDMKIYCQKCECVHPFTEEYWIKIGGVYKCKSTIEQHKDIKIHNHIKYNREYYLNYNKKWRKDNPKKYKKIQRRTLLKNKFNMTLNEYEELFNKQDGRCAICGQIETKKYKGKIVSLAVDHNHDTGEIRGLLCHRCNTMLGHFKDNPFILINAIKYLKRI